jgi:hypothetical protein
VDEHPVKKQVVTRKEKGPKRRQDGKPGQPPAPPENGVAKYLEPGLFKKEKLACCHHVSPPFSLPLDIRAPPGFIYISDSELEARFFAIAQNDSRLFVILNGA